MTARRQLRWIVWGTGLGALPFFVFRQMSRSWLGISNSIAAGFMLGASAALFWEGADIGVGRTALGALEIYCVDTEPPNETWKLAFDMRSGGTAPTTATRAAKSQRLMSSSIRLAVAGSRPRSPAMVRCQRRSASVARAAINTS